MQQNDDVISAWLSGSDSADNPAGPLYIDSFTEKKMTTRIREGADTMLKTTQSCASGCACC